MLDGTLIYIGFVFALAGFIKGVIGLGLPTISMGLLAVVMPPIEAAALLIIPSLLTNVWQMVDGPYVWGLLKRLGGMLIGMFVGGWLGMGILTGANAKWAWSRATVPQAGHITAAAMASRFNHSGGAVP